MKPIIKAINITKSYSDKDKILKGINLQINSNSFNVLLGQSGSGKSTLLNILSGLLMPTTGSVFLNGEIINTLDDKKISAIRRNFISNIYQEYMLLSNLTVRENIELGMGRDNLDILELVTTLGIYNCLEKFPDELSGGQKQRVAIARAVIKKPLVLFCDEATGALDEENSKQVITLLHNIRKLYNVTIIFATHNLKIALTADRVITVRNGLLVKDECNSTPLSPEEVDWGINV
ncbi:ABC transporter ATP-binding protein [Streptococcus salivarius]|jgi:ABC-type antimicrobial peptide transport system ATPase component|uniref:ABC transporter ATP-binding protein n=1 Tax=Streptococcus salivarius TaxID=1304 RepID=UPI0039C0B39D